MSNIQVELLKLFSADIPEEELLELKKAIAGFLLERARDKAAIRKRFLEAFNVRPSVTIHTQQTQG